MKFNKKTNIFDFSIESKIYFANIQEEDYKIFYQFLSRLYEI